MRLLKIIDIARNEEGEALDATLGFKEFFDVNETPKYAILSHTWGSEEVTFQQLSAIIEFQDNTHVSDASSTSKLDLVKQKGGYKKIVSFSYEAQRRGFYWGWVDTCCIDKSSSAELSEAINSMYQWYQRSGLCLAYLDDFHHEYDFSPAHTDYDHVASRLKDLEQCRWFTRGWTLQELIAPSYVLFLNSTWSQLFARVLARQMLSKITGINEDVLAGRRSPTQENVAQRMYWASKRKTTREEDIAYCLLGLFEVNMPLLYGEGKRAFTRLQEEIMKDSNDQSLFAWTHCAESENHTMLSHGLDTLSGLLASSPAQFALADGIVLARNHSLSSQYAMTNEGLRIEFLIYEDQKSGFFMGILPCTIGLGSKATRIALYLRPVESSQMQQFARWHNGARLGSLNTAALKLATKRTILVRKRPIMTGGGSILCRHGVFIRTLPHPDSGTRLISVRPSSLWDPKENLISDSQAEIKLTFTTRLSSVAVVMIRVELDEDLPTFATAKLYCACRLIKSPADEGMRITTPQDSLDSGEPPDELTCTSFVDTEDGRRLIASIEKTNLCRDEIFAVDIDSIPDNDVLVELPGDSPPHPRLSEQEKNNPDKKGTSRAMPDRSQKKRPATLILPDRSSQKISL